MDSKNKKIAHLFHWPSFPEYYESLLQIIALPTDTRGELKYGEKWVNKSFIDEVENINESNGYEAIFWVLNCKKNQDKKDIVTFEFAYPVRLVKILTVKKNSNNNYYINFIAKDFISNPKIYNKNSLKEFMNINFDDAQTPYPCVEKGFVYIGPKIEIKRTQQPSLEALYKVLENIPCSSKDEDKERIAIKEYPLVKIEEIKESKINKNGFYELLINQEYKIILSYYQGDDYRNRKIYINENEFTGKSGGNKNVTIEETKESKDKINNIKVKFNNHIFTIPLNVVV